MNRPPMLMHVKIQNKDRHFGLWLPLFLLVPLALVILVVLSPLIIIGLLILWWCGFGKWVRLSLKALLVAFVSCWALRGLQVDVQGGNKIVYISIV